MELKHGIKILVENKDLLMDRVFLSEGMEKALEPIDEFEYEDRAFRPKNTWRRPNNSELDILYARSGKCKYFETIGIHKLPNELIDKLNKLGIPGLRDENKYLDLKKNLPMEFLETMESLYSFKRNFLINNDVFHKLQIVFRRWDWPSLTVDIYNDNKIVGLHIDCWDQCLISECERASNRISVNLGLEPRYLLFVNQTAKSIYDMIGNNHSINFESNEQEELARCFFERFPNYPVIKLEIKPFEFYIAPTENMIHDGSSEGKCTPDISLTTRGNFNVYKT